MLRKVIRYFLVKMRPVFAQDIMFMTRVDHIINLYTVIYTSFYKSLRNFAVPPPGPAVHGSIIIFLSIYRPV